MEHRKSFSVDQSTNAGSESQGIGGENRNQRPTSVGPPIAEVNMDQTTAGVNVDQTTAGDNLVQTVGGDNLEQTTAGDNLDQSTEGIYVEQTIAAEGEEGTTEPQRGTATNIVAKVTEVTYRQ